MHVQGWRRAAGGDQPALEAVRVPTWRHLPAAHRRQLADGRPRPGTRHLQTPARHLRDTCSHRRGNCEALARHRRGTAVAPSDGPHISPISPQDGGYVHDLHGAAVRSRLTFLVYLNDGFDGGCTTFFQPAAAPAGAQRELDRFEVTPPPPRLLIIPSEWSHGVACGSGERETELFRGLFRLQQRKTGASHLLTSLTAESSWRGRVARLPEAIA